MSRYGLIKEETDRAIKCVSVFDVEDVFDDELLKGTCLSLSGNLHEG